MKAIDYLADFLSEQTKEERIFIAKSLLDNMDDETVCYLVLEEVEKFEPKELAWAKELIDDLTTGNKITQCSDDPFEIKNSIGEKHEDN